MIPHSWIAQCLYILTVAENIKALLVISRKKCRVMVHPRNLKLGKIEDWSKKYFRRPGKVLKSKLNGVNYV